MMIIHGYSVSNQAAVLQPSLPRTTRSLPTLRSPESVFPSTPLVTMEPPPPHHHHHQRSFEGVTVTRAHPPTCPPPLMRFPVMGPRPLSGTPPLRIGTKLEVGMCPVLFPATGPNLKRMALSFAFRAAVHLPILLSDSVVVLAGRRIPHLDPTPVMGHRPPPLGPPNGPSQGCPRVRLGVSKPPCRTGKLWVA